MPATIKIIETLGRLGVDAPFGINDRGVGMFVCFRLLCGSVDLLNKKTGEVVQQRHCFLTETKRRAKKNTIKEIVQTAFDGDFTIQQMDSYLNFVQLRNRGFWDRLNGELCLALFCERKGEQAKAFLHIYRLLEMVSVALPLFYASAEHDYQRALSFLKALPENPRDGDLAIMKKFVSEVARKGGFEDHNITIPYSKGDFGWDARYEAQIQAYVINAERLTTSLEVASKEISVPFSEFPSFFVSFRNRLFHNTLSQGNFNLDELNGSDLVCEPLIKPALNWLTLVLCVVVKQNLELHATSVAA